MLPKDKIMRIEKFVTPDGVEHPTLEAAIYWDARNRIVEMIHRVDPNVIDIDLASSVATVLGQNLDIVSEWMKAVDVINRSPKPDPIMGVINENP